MKLEGWGRNPVIEAEICRTESQKQLSDCLPDQGTTIPHGLGRSYGDSALNHHAICTGQLDKLLEFDPKNGKLTCESGVSFDDILNVFVPRGWFIPVVPGTKFITVGGAVASDIHGKNHHVDGCFSNFVDSLELMLPDGALVNCSREQNADLFRATCGGMGLTGIITKVRFRLLPIESSNMRQITVKAGNLEEVFELFKEYDKWPYNVAWMDCFQRKNRDWRSLFMAGKHATAGNLEYRPSSRITIPFQMPHGLINKFSVRWFNRLYFHSKATTEKEKEVPLNPFFFPLDRIQNWNRLYGRRGLVQYQVVFPLESSFEGIRDILERIHENNLYSTLGVLKKMGPENENYLSFPMEGYTIALDFKWSPAVEGLLDELDEIVYQFDGRHYLTKDARLSVSSLRKGYPDLEKFLNIRKRYDMNTTFQSLQSQRLNI